MAALVRGAWLEDEEEQQQPWEPDQDDDLAEGTSQEQAAQRAREAARRALEQGAGLGSGASLAEARRALHLLLGSFLHLVPPMKRLLLLVRGFYSWPSPAV